MTRWHICEQVTYLWPGNLSVNQLTYLWPVNSICDQVQLTVTRCHYLWPGDLYVTRLPFGDQVTYLWPGGTSCDQVQLAVTWWTICDQGQQLLYHCKILAVTMANFFSRSFIVFCSLLYVWNGVYLVRPLFDIFIQSRRKLYIRTRAPALKYYTWPAYFVICTIHHMVFNSYSMILNPPWAAISTNHQS